MSMSDTTAITIRDLAIGYPARHHNHHIVGDHLHATAPSGTLTCIIGRNGTGKSTLLRTIARLQTRLSGSIEIGSRDTECYSREQLARLMSIVLTARPETDNLTVGELAALGRAPYTGFWGRLSDNDREIAHRALAMVGMESMAHRRVSSLSDGECQKAMIAKSLAQDTPIILLDEPTAFVDFSGKVELMLLLRRLAHNEHKTILLSTHDLETALQTADRLWLLGDNGIDEGTPRQMADNGAIAAHIGRDDITIKPDLSLCLNA